jgi:CRP-like cAMP-binding protein
MFEALHRMVSHFVRFTDDEKRIFEQAFTVRHIPRKFTLIKEGQIARELFFINTGMLRLYYNKQGEEITGFIFREHLFSGSYESFIRQEPGIQYLESLEDCELLVLSYDNLNHLYEILPKVNIMTRKIAEQRFINAQKILSSFLLDSPEQRYCKFADEHADLLLRVPHHIIASYLGITPVSMSRIRNRLSK